MTLLLAGGASLYETTPRGALAQDFYWNAGNTFGDGSPTKGGSGTWSTTGNANWTTDPANNSPTALNWPNGTGLRASIDGSEFVTEITVSGSIDFDTITLSSGVYGQTHLVGSGHLNMAPSAPGGHVTFIGGNELFQRVMVDIVGSNDVYIESLDGTMYGGAITFENAKTYTGTTYIKSGFLTLGAPSDPISSYVVTNASILGDIIISNTAGFELFPTLNDMTFTNAVSSETSGDSAGRLYIRGTENGNPNSASPYRVIFNSDSSKFIGRTMVDGKMEGAGSVGGAVVVNTGGTIYNEQGSTLTLGTSIQLYPGDPGFPPTFPPLDPGTISGTLLAANSGQPLFVTSGDLNVADGLLKLDVQGPSFAQIYNVLQFGGQLTETAGTMFAEAPTITGLAGVNYRLDIVNPVQGAGAAPGMLRILVYDANDEIAQYWNGGAAPPAYTSNPLAGGNGTWSANTLNWTDSTGQNSANWANSVGIFAGTGGNIAVSGMPGIERLRFDVDNYVLQGGAGNALLLSPYSAATGVIEVANSGQTATIGVDIGNGNNYSATGTGAVVNTLEKTGAGTLIFTGDKAYSGLTTVSQGVLKLGDGTVTGGIAGSATVASGAGFGGAGSVGGNVTISAGGTLFGDQAGVLAVTGDLDLQAGTTMDVGLTSPSNTAIFTSNTLTLGGSGATTINVTNPGASDGTYALINAATTPVATNPASQFTLGSNIPSGSSISYSPVGHIYLNLFHGGPSGPAFVYWDGSTTSGAAPISGGSGNWNSFDVANTNWGDADPPTTHAVWKQGDIAIFTGNAGTVTVQTNGGADPVEAGGLHFAETGYSIVGDAVTLTAVNADNMAEIAVGPSAATFATISSSLDGAVGVNKTGAGELVLTGVNTYAGGTTLTGGVLSVSGDANLGAAAGGIVFAGGALKVTNGFSSAREMMIDKHGATIDVVNGGDQFIVSGRISDDPGDGGGLLEKVGAGTLTLTGVNSYAGGTAIREGTVSVASDGNLGAPTGGVVLDGGRLLTTAGFTTARDFQLTGSGGTIDTGASGNTLTATGRFADATNQTGSLTKTGDGTLVMTADNSYTGQTTIAGGTLQLGDNGASGSLNGDVAVDAGTVLNVIRSGDWIFNGIISGAGSFNQLGTGTTKLTADSSSFAGTTGVMNGGLSVSGKLGGMTTVGGMGLLSGTGMLEHVAMIAGGNVTAGSAGGIDTLSIADTLSFAPGSGMLVNVVSANTPDGLELDADLLDAAGAVSISGGKVTVDAEADRVVEGTTVTIISSADAVSLSDGDGDGVAGFDPEVASTHAFVGADIGYTADTVFLTLRDLTNNGTTLCIAGLTDNQCDTANGIQSLGTQSPLYGVIVNLSDGELGPSLDQLSGEGYSSVSSAMAEDSRYVRDATNTRLRQSRRSPQAAGVSLANGYAADDTMAAGAVAGEGPARGAWMTAYGSWNKYDATSNTAEIKDNVGGVFIGADMPVFDDVRFGAVVGYGSSSYDMSARNTSATSNDWTLGVYGGGAVESWGINFGMAYTWHDISASRLVAIPGLTEQENADYNAGTYQIYGDVDYMIDLASNFSAGPYLDAAYINQQTDGFTETGGIAALSREGSSMNTGFTTLGVRTRYALASGSFAGELVASAGWRRGYGDLADVGALTFAGSSAFTVSGAPIAQDQAVFNLGFQASVSESVDVGVDYVGLFAEGYQSQNVVGRLNMRF